MRILIYGLNFWPEPVGTGKYTGEMAAWLAARGHEIRVVTSPPHNPYWQVLPQWSPWKYSRERASAAEFTVAPTRSCPTGENLQVFRCPIWVPRSPGGLKRLAYLASFGLSSWPVVLKQIRWRPDVVLLIEPTLFCSPQALALASFAGAKAWLHVQDFEVDAAFELGDFSSSWIRGCALALERLLLRRFDRVSAISDRMVDRLMKKGVESARCIFFPNWVDTHSIFPLPDPSPFRRELGIDNHTVVAMYSGSLGRKQGLELLADAAKRLSDRTDLQFVFCGEGSYRQTFAEMVKDLSNVSLLPVQPQDRLNDLLSLADIHLLPQRADAADLVMPSKLTGMLASGRAVVTTADPGTQLESVVTGHGLVVPPGDSGAFVSAILRLTVDKDLRNRLGCEGRKYSQTHLDSERILVEFEQELFSLSTDSHDYNRLEREESGPILKASTGKTNEETQNELLVAKTRRSDL